MIQDRFHLSTHLFLFWFINLFAIYLAKTVRDGSREEGKVGREDTMGWNGMEGQAESVAKGKK